MDKASAKVANARPSDHATTRRQYRKALRYGVELVLFSPRTAKIQFLDFLDDRWRSEPPEPPFLPDIARLELALAGARIHGGAVPDLPAGDPAPSVRRHAAVSLLRCGHDVRPLFDDSTDDAEPAPREVFLVVGLSPNDEEPQVLEVAPALFDLLQALDDWTPVADFVAAAGDDAAPLLDEFVARGLLHVAT